MNAINKFEKKTWIGLVDWNELFQTTMSTELGLIAELALKWTMNLYNCSADSRWSRSKHLSFFIYQNTSKRRICCYRNISIRHSRRLPFTVILLLSRLYFVIRFNNNDPNESKIWMNYIDLKSIKRCYWKVKPSFQCKYWRILIIVEKSSNWVLLVGSSAWLWLKKMSSVPILSSESIKRWWYWI